MKFLGIIGVNLRNYFNDFMKFIAFVIGIFWEHINFSCHNTSICQLIKTLYGLKQSGREWNIEFDKQIRCHNFKHLQSDPCAYIQIENNDVAIITVWVDNL